MTAPAPLVARAAEVSRSGGAWSRGMWAVYLAMVVVTLDGSALNLALPHIGAQLQATASGLEWVLNAYTLPLAALVLLAGSLGDRLGARRMFILSAVGFGVASLACALSPTLPTLVAFRAIQGVCGAGLLPMVLALAVKTVPDTVERAKAINLVAVFGGGAIAAGPLLGGLVTAAFSWRGVFWLTLPPIAAAVYLIRPTPETVRSRTLRIDVPGQIVGTLALTALVSGMVEAGSSGWTSGQTVGLLLAGLAGLVAFVLIEQRAPSPMVPLSLFTNSTFTATAVSGVAFQFSVYGLQFMLAVYLQEQWGYSPLQAGLLLLSFSVGVMAATLGVNPRLLQRGPRFMLVTGTPLAVAGAILAMAAGGPGGAGWLVAGNALVGLGAGIYSPSLNAVAVESAGRARSGLASGVYNTARQFGQAAGVAVLGALATLPAATTGLRLGIVLCGSLSALILVLSLTFVPRATD